MVEDNPAAAATAPFDTQKKFVRLNRIRPDGFVEFEFAIGDPGLALELIMPAHAYRAFCHANRVAFLPAIDAPHQPSSSVAGPLHLMSHAI
jgi:phenol hydroxylase P0 protein